MEGVIDYLMRELLTDISGVDHCVTEFVRVTDSLLPPSAFYRLCPELYHNCQTRNGIPVTIQLLGSNPEMMALNAVKAVNLGAKAIDLNFGCPSRTVNKHKGGAVLLKEPEAIYTIVKALRQALPNNIPVTAKIRLGYDTTELALDNACAVEAAGAQGLTVHARTKVQGYKPPAHWEWIAKIKGHTCIPLTANGDIWTLDDAANIMDITGCHRIMIGRGVLRNPLLPHQIKQQLTCLSPEQQWQDSLAMLNRFITLAKSSTESSTENSTESSTEQNISHPYFITDSNRYIIGRVKQWLGMMSKTSHQALTLFQQIKRLNCSQRISDTLLNA